MKQVVKVVVPEIYDDEMSTIGTHTLRKLGYLFAVRGTLNHLSAFKRDATRKPMDKDGTIDLNYPTICYSDISMAARHKKVGTAALYIQNSTMLYWSVQEQGDSLSQHRVSIWKMNYIGPKTNGMSTIMAESHAYCFPIFHQAQYFIENEMKMPLLEKSPEARRAMSFGDVDHKLTGLASVRAMNEGTESTLVGILQEQKLSMDVMNQVIDLVNQIKQEAIITGKEGKKQQLETSNQVALAKKT
ncbi:hypothetical protein ACA910_007458 [Epithemia clementina (nom. ined.)]